MHALKTAAFLPGASIVDAGALCPWPQAMARLPVVATNELSGWTPTSLTVTSSGLDRTLGSLGLAELVPVLPDR